LLKSSQTQSQYQHTLFLCPVKVFHWLDRNAQAWRVVRSKGTPFFLARVFISLGTVKWYPNGIYHKPGLKLRVRVDQ